MASLPYFLSSLSLSLSRLQLRTRFVRTMPTYQIPHDFRRICNSKLVNQLSKYTFKLIWFGKVSHNFITKSEDWEPQLSATLGPLPSSCINPLTSHLAMTLKRHVLAFSGRKCQRHGKQWSDFVVSIIRRIVSTPVSQGWSKETDWVLWNDCVSWRRHASTRLHHILPWLWSAIS